VTIIGWPHSPIGVIVAIGGTDMLKHAESTDAPHPGINISSIPVGGGVAGFLAALSIVVIGLIGVPLTRWFLGASLVVGGAAALLRKWMDDRG